MKSTQFGWGTIFILLLVLAIVIYQVPSRNYFLYVGILFAILILLFYNLTITVTDSSVSFKMGIGLINGKYELNQIEDCRPVTYFPLGWGIRLRPGVLLYNVSGNKAIELKIKGKNRRVWIGTNSPDEFSTYINQKIKK